MPHSLDPALSTSGAVHFHSDPQLSTLVAADYSRLLANLRSPNRPNTLLGRFLFWWRGPIGNKFANLRAAGQEIRTALRAHWDTEAHPQPNPATLETFVSTLQKQLETVQLANRQARLDEPLFGATLKNHIREFAGNNAKTIEEVLGNLGVEIFLDKLETNLKTKCGPHARMLAMTICEAATIAYAEKATRAVAAQASDRAEVPLRARLTALDARPTAPLSERLANLQALRADTLDHAALTPLARAGLLGEIDRVLASVQGEQRRATLNQELDACVTHVQSLPDDLKRLREQHVIVAALRQRIASEPGLPATCQQRVEQLEHALQARLRKAELAEKYEAFFSAATPLRKVLDQVSAAERAVLHEHIARIEKAAGPLALVILRHLADKLSSKDLLLHLAAGDATVIDALFTRPETFGHALQLKRELGLARLPANSVARAEYARAIQIDFERRRAAHALNEAVAQFAGTRKMKLTTSMFSALGPNVALISWIKKNIPRAVGNLDLMIGNWIMLSCCDRSTGVLDEDQARPLLAALGTGGDIAALRGQIGQGFQNSHAVATTGARIVAFAKALQGNDAAAALQAGDTVTGARKILPQYYVDLLGESAFQACSGDPAMLDGAVKRAVATAIADLGARLGLGARISRTLAQDTPAQNLGKAVRLAIMLAYIEHGGELRQTTPRELDHATRTIMARWAGAHDASGLPFGHPARDQYEDILGSALASDQAITTTGTFIMRTAASKAADARDAVMPWLDRNTAAPQKLPKAAALAAEAVQLSPGASTTLRFSYESGVTVDLNKTATPLAGSMQHRWGQGILIERGLDGAYAVTLEKARTLTVGVHAGLRALLKVSAEATGESADGVRLAFASRDDCERFVLSLMPGETLTIPDDTRIALLSRHGVSTQLDAGVGTMIRQVGLTANLMAAGAISHTVDTIGHERIDRIETRLDASATAAIDVQGLNPAISGSIGSATQWSVHTDFGLVQADSALVDSISIEQPFKMSRVEMIMPRTMSAKTEQTLRQRLKVGRISEATRAFCEYRLKQDVIDVTLPAIHLDPALDAAARASKTAAILKDRANYAPWQFRWQTDTARTASALSVPHVLSRAAEHAAAGLVEVVDLRDG